MKIEQGASWLRRNPRLFSFAWQYAAFLCMGATSLALVKAAEPEDGKAGAIAEKTAPLQYTVGFSEANQHRITVDMLVPVDTSMIDQAGDVELAMAVWTPGSYLVREFARHVEAISANDVKTGEPLTVRRTKKNRWKVTAGNASLLRVSYRLYCREMSVRTNWVDADMGILNGAATFLTLAADLDSHRSRTHQVEFVLPPNWRDAIAELPSSGDRTRKFVAESFDALVDAPVVLGNPITESFDVGGVPHRLVCLGDVELWDIKKASEDVAAIVTEQQKFWNSVPYQSYTFLNVIGEGRGGLEHDNSCLMMTSRWSFRDPKRYRRWLGLVSHEFFHTWNVRRLRPLGLQSYDYEIENYTDGLWVAEGVTSYYDDLLQCRAGKLSVKEYLERLSGTIASLEGKPGANVQSLADSSRDSWIKFYRPNENSRNATVSYYGKGSLVAWLLDTRIRLASENQNSLDDCMRELYKNHAGVDRSFTMEDLRLVVQNLADEATADWLLAAVQEPNALDYTVALDYWGLTFANDDDDSGNNKAEKPEGDTSEDSRQLKHLPDLGVELRFAGSIATVETILRGQPASLAGWNVGDELIALNKYRINEEAVWESALKQLPAGVPTEALISRRGRVLSTVITWASEKPPTWKLKRLESSTKETGEPNQKNLTLEQQTQRQNQWLGQTNEKQPVDQK